MAEKFNAGDRVPNSGVYRVSHAGEHSQPHYVTALYGDAFPACRECVRGVCFELAMSAMHVNAHPLFTHAFLKR